MKFRIIPIISSIMIFGILGGLSNAYALSFEWDQDLYMIDHGGILTLILDQDPGSEYDVGIIISVGLDDGSTPIEVTLSRDSGKKFGSQFVDFTNSANGNNQLHIPMSEDNVGFTAVINDPLVSNDPDFPEVPPASSEVSQETVDSGRDLPGDYAKKKTRVTVVDVDCDDAGFGGDTDGDGLCNNWETNSGLVVFTDPNGPSYTLGCTDGLDYTDDPLGIDVCPDPNMADLYYEIDYMTGHKPNETGLLQVINAFRWSNYQPPEGEKNVNLHIQLDEELSHVDRLTSPGSINNPGTDQLKRWWYGTENERDGDNYPTTPWEGEQRNLKNQAFHYAIFAHERFGHIGTSGYSEIPGNDVMISLGSWDSSVGSPDTQAGTFLHEIGHNLGIDHGGEDAVNCKPNYISVMSFTRQTSDLVDRDAKLSSRAINDLNENLPQGQLQALGQYPKQPMVVYSNSQEGVFETAATDTEIDFGTPTQLNYFPGVDCNLDEEEVLISFRDSLNFEFLALGHGNWKDGVSRGNSEKTSGENEMGSTIIKVQLQGDTSSNPTYIEHVTASVITPQGTSVPGCEDTNNCFIPNEVTVDVGGMVTWSNNDTAAHTVTSGTPGDGPSGVFDSSLFMAGTIFTHMFDEEGEIPYFCMVHPWMVGIVTVQAASPENGNTVPDDVLPENGNNNPGISPTGIPLDICVNKGSDYHGKIPNPAFDRICVGDELKFDDSLAMRKLKVNSLENTVATISNSDFVDPSRAESNKIEYSDQLEKVRLHIGDQDMLSAIEETKTFQSWFDGKGEKEYIENKATRDRIYNETSNVLEAQLTVVPEFETVAIIVLSISIISVIALTSKSKLSMTRINQ